MKLSIVIPVLNSHEILRRQVEHFKKMNLPDDVEIIIVDDGSRPPLQGEGITIIPTHDYRSWTQPKARNIGAKAATGEFLLFTDIDHIITREAIEFGRNCKYDYARFRRELAVLDEDGNITQDREVLTNYGVKENRGLRIGCHVLSMVIRASVFMQIGGFREQIGKYPTHDDADMKRKLKLFSKCPDSNPDERALIYMIPNGRFCEESDYNYNPFGLFHALKRWESRDYTKLSVM